MKIIAMCKQALSKLYKENHTLFIYPIFHKNYAKISYFIYNTIISLKMKFLGKVHELVILFHH